MPGNQKKVYYSEYLQLEKLLTAQLPESEKRGDRAHDELLFIIVHQVYELWFKQILFELDEVNKSFAKDYIQEGYLSKAFNRLIRVNRIFETMNSHFRIMETMTPMDFLEFRNLLAPASGFQSIQFKKLEAKLGLQRQWRQHLDKNVFFKGLKQEDQNEILETEKNGGLLQYLDSWLSRMPFLDFSKFNFWEKYRTAVVQMFAEDQKIIDSLDYMDDEKRQAETQMLDRMKNNILHFLDPEKFSESVEQGEFKLSQKACLAALFINVYREEPLLQAPFQFINEIMDLDENLGTWRYKHSMMAQRMLGIKIGTGGSSGHDYLKSTIESNRIFGDFFRLSSFYIPRSSLPELPKELKKELSFAFSMPKNL